MSMDINTLIKAPMSNVFRRALIKRRDLNTGLFEDSWVNISKDVKSYGKITQQLDSARRYKFTFGNAKLVMENSKGEYNPHTDLGSLWYGYLSQQRTLVRLEAGYFYSQKNDNGIWVNSEFPSDSIWDENAWDAPDSLWDATQSSAMFTGVISGDIVLGDNNDVTFNIKPLISIFQEYPARNLTGWTSTGLTASQFVNMVVNQTDGSGNFIFKPFFGNTSTNFDVSTTVNVYGNLNTSGAEDVIDKNVWEVIEKLAEAENFLPYVTKTGIFKFISRDTVATSTVFEFHGTGSFNGTYGHTIKKVSSYGFKQSKYYSRVEIKFSDVTTTTSFAVVESTLTVSGTNNPWVLGAKTLKIENVYIQNTATAITLATNIFNDVSALKNEVEFETTFVPHLEIFDRISIFYDPNPFRNANLWDQKNWAADDTSTSDDLIFDKTNYDALLLEGQEFKFLSFETDLDNFSNKFIAREV
jgi:hypothetical protein